MQFHKISDSKKYTLTIDTADKTLQNIFAACEQTPNNIPLQRLASQKSAIVKPLNIMIGVCHFVLFIVLLLPFVMHQPKYHFTTYNKYDSFYIKEHYAEQENVFIRVNTTELNLSKCYMVDSKGAQYPVKDFNTTTNTLILPFYDDFGDIYLSDESGHTLHVLLTAE